MHGDHSDRVAVTDLRSALLRAGVDANSRVALAAFAELQRTGRTHVDFDAFLRVANAVAAHSDSRGAPKPTVPPSPPGAAPPPTGAPPSAAWSTWSEIPDDPYAVRPAALVGGGSAAATAAAPAAAAPSSYPTAAYPPQPADAAPPSALAAYRGATAAAPIPPSPKEEPAAPPTPGYGDPLKAGLGSPPSTGGSSAKKGAVTAEAKRTARRPVEAGAAASPADPYAVVPKVALHKLPPKEPYAAAKAKPPATKPPATKPPTRRRL